MQLISNLEKLNLYAAFVVGFVCCMFPSAQAQEYLVERTITVDDGLPSNETYASFSDSLGNLWILTDRGIAIYDGEETKVLTTKDGLPSNTVLKYFKAPDGVIWFTTDRGVCYLHGDSFLVPEWNDKLINHPEYYLINRLVFDKNENVLVVLDGSNGHFFTCSMLSNSVTFNQVGLKYEEYMRQELLNGDVVISMYQRSFKDVSFVCNAVFPKESYKPFGKAESIKFLKPLKPQGIPIKACVASGPGKSDVYYSGFQKVYHWDGHNQISAVDSFSGQVIFLKYHKNSLYVGVFSKGLYKINTTTGKKECLQSGISPSGVFFNKNSTYVSTLSEGVFVINEAAKTLFSFENHIKYQEAAKPFFFDGTMFKVLENYEVKSYSVEQDELRLKEQQVLEAITNRPKYNYVNWITGDSLLFSFDAINYKTKVSSERINEQKKNVSTVEPSKISKRLYYFGRDGFIVLDSNMKTVFASSDSSFNFHVHSMVEISLDSVLVGTDKGVFVFDGFQLRRNRLFESVSNTRISHMLSDSKGRVFMGTKGMGLVTFSGKKIEVKNSYNGLADNFVNALKFSRDTLWVGTGDGLQLVRLEENQLKISEILIHTSVNFIYLIENTVYLENGAKMFQLTRPYPTVKGREVLISQDSWKSYWCKTNMDELPEFRINETPKFNLQLNELKDFNSNQFAFYLEPIQEKWTYQNKENLEFQKLPFNNYTLSVKAKSSSGLWTPVKQVSFSVIPYWYQRKWFQPTLYVTIGLLISSFIFVFQRERAKRYAQQNLMLKSSLSALKLQMNPHFIFNALNSLNYLIVSDKKKESTRFLGQFSSLVRDVLDGSFKSFVSLELELKRLKNYIELEEVRLDRGIISFEVNNETKYAPSKIQVPNMMLQPLIENAIWHGFPQSKVAPTLKITLKQIDSVYLSLNIQDNGIGIDLDALSKKMDEDSVAIKNIEERLRLFSKLDNKRYTISFKATNPGTLVQLVLPLKVNDI